MKTPKREKYKNSPITYIRKMPEHWTTAKIKQVFEIQLGKMLQPIQEEHDDVLVPYLKAGHVQWKEVSSLALPEMWIAPKDITKYEIHDGDLLVCEGGEVGRSALAKDINAPTIIQNSLHRIRPTSKGTNEYLLYLLHHICRTGWFDVLCNKATIAHLTSDKLGNVVVCLPPVYEQKEITTFLNKETFNIDRLIEKKLRLIKRLQEKRQALITQAVTKGLDPHGPLKDSGIPWLGEVPEHWEVLQLKRSTRILRGQFSHRPRNDPMFYDGDYPFVQTGDVATAKKYIVGFKQTLNENGFKVSREFPAGTLVMTIAANIGDVAILTFNSCFPDSIIGFVPNTLTDVEFLFYCLKSYKPALLQNATQNTQLNLNIERVGEIKIALPSKMEQQVIVAFLNESCSKIDGIIEKTEQQINLILEYRQALISAAITGQIDVQQHMKEAVPQ